MIDPYHSCINPVNNSSNSGINSGKVSQSATISETDNASQDGFVFFSNWPPESPWQESLPPLGGPAQIMVLVMVLHTVNPSDLTLKKKGPFQFCHQALLGIHKNSKQKEIFSLTEGFFI